MKTVEESYRDLENKIFGLGAAAYRDGKTQADNPFSPETHAQEHESWRLGWHEEYAYWEYEASIRTNMK